MTSLFAFGSFLFAYWQWILIGTVGAAILAYVAFILRNWKIAVAVAVMVALFLSHQAMYSAGYGAHVAEEAAKLTVLLQGRIDTLEAVTKEDAKRADEDADTIERLRAAAAETPANATVALPAAAARRIGGIK